MGQIVAAVLAAHVPPLMAGPEIRAMLSPDLDTSLIDGLAAMRTALDAAQVDGFIIFDTHWITTTEHVVDGADHHRGVFTSEELPHLMNNMSYDFAGAPALAACAEAIGASRGVRIINWTATPLPKHYPSLNLLHYLHRDEQVLIAGTCQTAEPHNFLAFGEVLAAAVEETDGNYALIASGGMSHRFWPMDNIFQHSAFDPINIVTDAAREMDLHILDLWAAGDHAAVIDLYPQYRAHSPEGRFGHYLAMVGALAGRDCRARGRLMSRYESAMGTGQAHVWFDLAGDVA